MNFKNGIKKISGFIIALALIVGVLVPNLSIADENIDRSEEVVVKLEENGKEKDIMTWKPGKNNKYTENGKEIEIINETPVELAGNTKKGEKKVTITKYIEVDELMDEILYRENIDRSKLDLEKTEVRVSAKDYPYEGTYDKFVNLDMKNLVNMSKPNGDEGFNGKIVMEYVDTTNGDVSISQASGNKSPRYYGGVRKDEKGNFNPNMGSEAVNGIDTIKITLVYK